MNRNRSPQLIKLIIALECVLLCAFLILLSPVGVLFSNSVPVNGQKAENAKQNTREDDTDNTKSQNEEEPEQKKEFIKWVDFQVTKEAMQQAFRYDVDSFQSEIHLNWIELLAFLGARYGGDFSRYQAADMKAIVERVQAGEKMEDITADMKYYHYYLETYTAVLGGMVGEFKVEIPVSQAPDFALNDSQSSNESKEESTANTPSEQNSASQEENEQVTDGKVWVSKYGLKAFSPIAKNYPYHDYDDFGVARSYGFKRQHLGHDMMGQVGTPVIAVESGYVEAIGWNQYGGWRLGIRSFDKKRYYYYAHLRKNYPYHKSLQEGSIVQAGDVIGYLGRTGYSRTENTNNIDEPHLHFGIQLIFDESQKDGNNEIWIDCYELVKFLAINRAETVKNQETKEYYRVYQMIDPVIPGRPMEQRLPEKSPEVEESIVPEESQKSEEDTKEETKPEETITQESETA